MNALIKFLSGIQSGAELILQPGKYVLGSGDEADLVIVDSCVLPIHANLVIGTDTWHIEPINAAKLLVDAVVVQDLTPLSSYQVFSLGGVHVAIGPDGAWAESPTIPLGGVSEAQASDTSSTKLTVSAEAPNGRQDGRTRRHFFRKLLLIFLLTGATLACIHMYWEPARIPDPEDELLRASAEALRAGGITVVEKTIPGARLPAGSIALEISPSDTLEIYGLVETDAKRDLILELLSVPKANVVNRVSTVTEQISLASTEVRCLFPSLALVTEKSKFSVRLEGIVARTEDAAAAYRMTRQYLDESIIVRRNIWIWSELKREAERVAERVGMENTRFTWDGVQVDVKASPWPSSELRDDFMERFAGTYGGTICTYFSAALEKPHQNTDAGPKSIIVQPPLPELLPTARSFLRDESDRPDDTSKVEQVQSFEGEIQPPQELQAVLSEDVTPSMWYVVDVFKNGFSDQHEIFHTEGESITDGVQLVRTWRNGVVLQKGQQTIFATKGMQIILDK